MPKTKAVACLILFLASPAAAQPARVEVDDAALSLFRERRVDGAFVLRDLADDATWVVGAANADTRVTPASTFKIPNALIALETRVASGPSFPLPWDGQARPIAEWNRDHDLASAIRFSVVWYFREIARRIGRRRMQRYVTAFDYGNRDISSGVDRFWLNGSLRISAREQAGFLAKLARDALPLRPATMAAVREMIVLDRQPDHVLYGKTGSERADGRSIGWLVGIFTKGERRYTYATLLWSPGDDLARQRPLRLELTRALLSRRGLL